METAQRNQTSFPLHEAVESGNLELLKTLLDNGGDINAKNNIEETLLHVAVIKNNHQSQELVTLLLERGANPRLQNRDGESPLILAVKNNPNCVPMILRNGSGIDTVDIPSTYGSYPLHYAIENEIVLKMLLDNGAFIECKDGYGRTALHLASRRLYKLSPDRPMELSNNQPNYYNVYYNVIKQLLMHGAEVNSKDNYGRTPLHSARDSKGVRLLLGNGALVNSRDDFGRTPLHYVDLGDSYDIAYELLMHGANVNSEDNDGRTPLHRTSDIKCVRLLLEKGALVNSRDNSGKTPLYNLSYDKAYELLMHGANVNSKDNNGRTPLHMPCDIKCFRLLLNKGALVNSRDNSGKTPLHYKTSCFSCDKAYELLMHGADVNSKDNDGNTPLHMTGNVKCVRLLLDNGALVNSQDNSGKTPLHKAVRYSYDRINELLMHGADVNSKDNDGNTPLHLARSVKCVRLLLDKGALVNLRNSVGKTPLHKLSMYDTVIAYELLLHGADVNSKDNYGNTPLHTTCDNERDLLTERYRHHRQDLMGVTILDYLENTRHRTYFYVANILLDWGASLTTKDNKGRTPPDICPNLLDWAKPHNVRKACVKLSDIPCEKMELKRYWTSCLDEAARLKLVWFGKNSLYDIFGQYSDPIFLSNELLQKAVNTIDEIQYPIYFSLLKSTYKLAEKRSCMLEDAADTLQTPLPREITWYILTFVDDDSLQNVIKTKDAK